MIHSSDELTSMAPGLLVASPRLDGGPFERAVILVVQHDRDGAVGVVVNKPVDVKFGDLIASVNAQLVDQILNQHFTTDVYFGGPVRLEQLWVLFDAPGQSGHVEPSRDAGPTPAELGPLYGSADLDVGDGWTFSASGQVIEDFAVHSTDDYFMPVLGYAGWEAGQLEAEIGEGSWLVADFDDALIKDTASADCWERALEAIGVAPTAFLMMGEMGSA